jgi:hexosaminidase
MLGKLFFIIFIVLFPFFVDSTNPDQIVCNNVETKHLDNYPIWKSVNITKRDIVQPIYSKNILKSLLPNRLFHLDLKGAKPTIDYLIELLQFASRYGATGVLLEYEDTFPYSGELAKLRASHAFSISDIHRINNECSRLNLALIPLVQTCGHLEFVLKHGQYSYLREVSRFPNVICPSQTASHDIINSMISQILSLHPAARYLHIGCDEMFHINKCPLCRSRNATAAQIYMGHVKAVAQMARNNSASHNLRVIIWDDMLRAINESDLRRTCR